MKRSFTTVLFILTIALVFARCAPYKMKAIRAERDQRHDIAITYALKHLASNPTEQSTLALLNRASRQYYNDLQQKINHFESLNDWITVTRLAEQGRQTLTDVSRVVGTNFPSKNELDYLKSKSEQSKFNQADELYAAALQFYRSGDYFEALKKFSEIEAYTRHFKDTDRLVADTKQKLASQTYQQGKNLLSQGNLEAALATFAQTTDYVPDFLDASHQINQIKMQLTDSYLKQGQTYLNAGDYRNAFNLLKKSLQYGPDNSRAQQLLTDAKEKLTVRLAVFPFSSSKMDQKFGAIVSQTIISRALPKQSEFVQFLDRENLQKIFEEQALSQTGAIDEKTAVEVGKISGVNTIVVGSVTLVSDQKTQPTKRTLTGHYDKNYRDPKGVQRTKKEPFNYTAYELRRNVEVNVSYRLINVETSAIVANESINRQATDAAEWITCPADFVQHLPYSEKQKLKASKEPKNVEALINQAIDSLTGDVASKILSKVSQF